MTANTKRRVWVLGILVVAIGSALGTLLQFGLLNWGQEFGTYGQYNRVLAVARSMDGYTLVDSRLSRRIDWRNLGQLDRFSVRVRDPAGTIGSAEFQRGSPEMKERDPVVLERIIKFKLKEQPSAVRGGMPATR